MTWHDMDMVVVLLAITWNRSCKYLLEYSVSSLVFEELRNVVTNQLGLLYTRACARDTCL
jgi:hypothetical protein